MWKIILVKFSFFITKIILSIFHILPTRDFPENFIFFKIIHILLANYREYKKMIPDIG